MIGISSWSASLLRMVDAIHPMKRLRAERVVQILGGIGDPSVQSHATQLTTRLAALTGAEAQLLPAQGVVSSSAARLVMLGDVYVRAAMDQFRRLTIALVGIGALQPSVMLANSGNAFTNDELRDLARRGAVGDIGLRFFDREGASCAWAARRPGDQHHARRAESNAARRSASPAAIARSRRSAPA